MDELKKFGALLKAPDSKPDMAKINAQAMRELAEEEVYTFKLAACNDRVDRDNERFTADCLRELAPLFVGRPVLTDHNWSAGNQIARIYDAYVEGTAEGHRLVLCAYMLRTEQTAPVIAALQGGILRECSVGCAVRKATCSICGTDKTVRRCEHRPGKEYDGVRCVVELSEAFDAYEVSIVAVPAQPGAGVTKQYGGEDSAANPPPEGGSENVRKALALLELEEKRY